MSTGTVLANPNRYRHWKPKLTLHQVFCLRAMPGEWNFTGKTYAVKGFRDGDQPDRVRFLKVYRYSWPR